MRSMSLVRAWTRQLSGASGAAVIAPMAVFGSMVLLALAGGFGSLGRIGQALAGPAIPTGVRSASAATTSGGNGNSVAALLPIVARGGTPTLVASVALPGRSGGGPGSGHNGGPGGSNGNRPASGNPAPAPGNRPPSSPVSGGPPVTSPPPPPPTLVDGVVSLGTSITSRIPGPVGQLATSALQDVGHTIDGVIPHTGRSGASRVAGAVRPTVSQLQNGVGQLGSGVSGLLHGLHVP
jgi:hypothetical protein